MSSFAWKGIENVYRSEVVATVMTERFDTTQPCGTRDSSATIRDAVSAFTAA
jgi:hypothetical protein